jgi:hypothetical protein
MKSASHERFEPAEAGPEKSREIADSLDFVAS